MQQLNFYRHLDKAEEQPCSALQVTWLAGASAILMVVIYLGLWISGMGVDSELAAMSKQKKALDQQVLALEQRKASELKNPELAERLEWLEGEVAFRRQLLATVDPNAQLAQGGFAEYLQGLGRQVIEGLWFTGIELNQSGGELVLTGNTLEPEYLPRYLQKLSSERVFKGHQFQVLRMNLAEKRPGGMQFEVRSSPQGSKS